MIAEAKMFISLHRYT